MEVNDRLRDKYIDPFTDFGFKKLFGEECNKDLLLDFLNELLHKKEGKIINLTYLKSEQLGRSDEDRKAIFDLHCENEKGEKIIVEMQKTKQKFFKDRELYYSKYRYDIMLTDIDTHKIFYKKLMFTYLEMPKFNK